MIWSLFNYLPQTLKGVFSFFCHYLTDSQPLVSNLQSAFHTAAGLQHPVYHTSISCLPCIRVIHEVSYLSSLVLSSGQGVSLRGRDKDSLSTVQFLSQSQCCPGKVSEPLGEPRLQPLTSARDEEQGSTELQDSSSLHHGAGGRCSLLTWTPFIPVLVLTPRDLVSDASVS